MYIFTEEWGWFGPRGQIAFIFHFGILHVPQYSLHLLFVVARLGEGVVELQVFGGMLVAFRNRLVSVSANPRCPRIFFLLLK